MPRQTCSISVKNVSTLQSSAGSKIFSITHDNEGNLYEIGYVEGMLDVQEQQSHLKLPTLYVSKSTFEEDKRVFQFISLFPELVIAEDIGSKNDMKQAYGNLSDAYAEQKQFKKAYEYHRLYSELKDSIFNTESAMQIAGMQAQYESEKKEKKIVLLKKEKELQDIKLKQRTTQRNAFIVGFGLVIILALVIFIAYRQSKIATRQKAQRQIEKHLHEIDLLRANINMQITQPPQKFKITIKQEELNRYLLNPMTKRELDVLYLISDGKMNKEIADKLFVSVNTIKTHILKIYEKLDVRSRTQAAMKAGSLDILNNKNS